MGGVTFHEMYVREINRRKLDRPRNQDSSHNLSSTRNLRLSRPKR